MSPLKSYYGFASQAEFEAFDAVLTRLLAAGQAALISQQSAADFLLPYQPDACYELSGTAEQWALATPDNAWRGYFLPVTEAIVYQQQLRRRESRIRSAGLLLLLCLLCFIAWRLLR
ncbi:hypothetical protein E4631_12100 [Hymenobacter sp. UV11]|uniref:hypothetical protein n=1 Tax=Hymenobacter sp. UV11 TaxID=1849735 RepID=UPI00105F1907|nr:hypothetical protein [Hymenobacter sp. UV11]TFZ65844.1 hypothetical protein E4631_12100 [Hymenobacter sp. UV11]